MFSDESKCNFFPGYFFIVYFSLTEFYFPSQFHKIDPTQIFYRYTVGYLANSSQLLKLVGIWNPK